MNPNDLRALTLINEGVLTTNPETGEVWHKGNLARVEVGGYVRVKGMAAHRIVWLAEYGFIEDGHQINHRNRRRNDNRLLNPFAVEAAPANETLSSVALCRIFRDSANAADTATITAGLLFIDAHIEMDRLGSRDELTQ